MLKKNAIGPSTYSVNYCLLALILTDFFVCACIRPCICVCIPRECSGTAGRVSFQKLHWVGVFGTDALYRADFLICSQIGPKLVPSACYKGFQSKWQDVTQDPIAPKLKWCCIGNLLRDNISITSSTFSCNLLYKHAFQY